MTLTIQRIDVPAVPPRMGSTVAIRVRVATDRGTVWAVVRPGPGGWQADSRCLVVDVDGDALPDELAESEPEDVLEVVEVEVVDAVFVTMAEDWWLV